MRHSWPNFATAGSMIMRREVSPCHIGDPTIRSRELGDGLRQAMEAAGLTGKQAAAMLDWSPSFVSMLLTGKRQTSEVDIAAFLGVCRVKGPKSDRLLALWRDQDTPGWFQQHGSRMPKQLVTLIAHEN